MLLMRRHLLALACIIGHLVLTNSCALAAPTANVDLLASTKLHGRGSAAAVSKLIARVLGSEHASRFDLGFIADCPSPHNGTASLCFVISDVDMSEEASTTRIKVRGTSAAELAFGVGFYLREYMGMNFGWDRAGGSQTTPVHSWKQKNRSEANVYTWPSVETAAPVVRVRAVPLSYFNNVVTFSYSFVWYGFAEWEKWLDWAALSGMNIAIAYTGQEEIYRRAFAKFGIDDEAFLEWCNGPAYLAWQRGQEYHGISGPLPLQWVTDQYDLQIQLLERMRALGMIPVLPAFQGNVPTGFRDLFPSANISATGNAWVDAFDPLFSRVQKVVLEQLIESFGTDHWYAADGYFNQNSPPWLLEANIGSGYTHTNRNDDITDRFQNKNSNINSSDSKSRPKKKSLTSSDDNKSHVETSTTLRGSVLLTNASSDANIAAPQIRTTSSDASATKSFVFPDVAADEGAQRRAQVVYDSMTAVDPNAVWLFQGWVWRGWSGNDQQLSYIKGWVEGVPKNRFIVLNMWDEVSPDWKVHSYFGAPFIWSVLHNFGGNTGMWGSLQAVFDGPAEAVAANTSVVGTGAAPEGIDQNPIYYNLVMDVNWQPQHQPSTSTHSPTLTSDDDSTMIANTATVSNTHTDTATRSNTSLEHYVLDHYVPQRYGWWGTIVTADNWAAHVNHRSSQNNGGILRIASASLKNKHNHSTNISRAIFEAQTAWTGLLATVYNNNTNYALIQKVSGFLAEKNCDGITGLPFSGSMATPPETDWYNVTLLVNAWGGMIRAGAAAPRPLVRPFVYDLVNVGREVLAKLSNRSFKQLLDATAIDDLQEAAGEHFDLMRDVDALLCMESSFSTADWIAQARRLSKPHQGLTAEYLEMNARAQTTTWGPQKKDAALGSRNRDYANKQWGGQVLGFYSERLKCYVTQKMSDLKEGREDVDKGAFELCAGKVSYEWTHDFGAKQFPLCVVHDDDRDVVQLSRALFDKYSAHIG